MSKTQIKIKFLLINFLFAFITYILYFITGDQVGRVILPILFPNTEHIGLAILALAPFMLAAHVLVYAWFTTVIAFVCTRQFLYVLFAPIFFIFLISSHLFISYKISAVQQNKEHAKKVKESDKKIAEAKQLYLEVIDFEEKGELDEEGYLKNLTIKTKLKSNKRITLLNPFRIQTITYNKGLNQNHCFFADYSFEKTSFNLVTGENEIKNSINQFDIDSPWIGSDSATFAVGLRFFLPEKDMFGRELPIENVVNLSNKPFDTDCEHGYNTVTFTTKTYKVHLKKSEL